MNTNYQTAKFKVNRITNLQQDQRPLKKVQNPVLFEVTGFSDQKNLHFFMHFDLHQKQKSYW